jgi:hypothetical protein
MNQPSFYAAAYLRIKSIKEVPGPNISPLLLKEKNISLKSYLLSVGQMNNFDIIKSICKEMVQEKEYNQIIHEEFSQDYNKNNHEDNHEVTVTEFAQKQTTDCFSNFLLKLSNAQMTLIDVPLQFEVVDLQTMNIYLSKLHSFLISSLNLYKDVNEKVTQAAIEKSLELEKKRKLTEEQLNNCSSKKRYIINKLKSKKESLSLKNMSLQEKIIKNNKEMEEMKLKLRNTKKKWKKHKEEMEEIQRSQEKHYNFT